MNMDLSWQPMDLGEFAAFERSQGRVIIKTRDVHWERVRPFFYRPMLPFHELPADSIAVPLQALFGGVQYAVSPGQKTNSFVNLLLFEDVAAYCLDSLERHKKKQVRQAEKVFDIQQINDLDQFKQQAYRVYLSFYKRTQYEYKSERRHPNQFGAWAESIFQFPKVVVLGAFSNGELGAIGITKLVGNTLIYSTTFCTTESLQLDVTSLMLHSLREAAARQPGVEKIFVGNYKFQGRKGVDEFYFTRGCKLVSKPAWLHLNPLTALGLKRFALVQYGRLIGDIKDVQTSPVSEPGTIPAKPGIKFISGKTKAVESGRIIPPAARS